MRDELEFQNLSALELGLLGYKTLQPLPCMTYVTLPDNSLLLNVFKNT